MTRKFFLRLGAALAMVALVAACATGPRVRTDADARSGAISDAVLGG